MERDSVKADRAYIEIDLRHLEHNVTALKKALPAGCEIMAVLKSEAYGHGAYEVGTYLDRIGVRAFAVSTIEEGIRLRQYGVRGEILILGYTGIQRAGELSGFDLTQTLIDATYAEALNGQGVPVKAHIKVDTGMHRLGIDWRDADKAGEIFGMKYIKVSGMYTHLCCSDGKDPEETAFTGEQIRRFYGLADTLRQEGHAVPKLHVQSSYGFWNYPDVSCDYVRAGAILYGVKNLPGEHMARELDLRPVLSLKSKIVLIRSVPKGESVGYGRSFVAERDSRIAVLPIGYGDGYPRSLSNGRGSVLAGRHIVPVVGRICMNQLMVDITDAGEVNLGDPVTLIGAEGYEEISAPAVAERAGSFSPELLCRLGARLPVVTVS